MMWWVVVAVFWAATIAVWVQRIWFTDEPTVRTSR